MHRPFAQFALPLLNCAIAVPASCAFTLVVATPSNAIVCATQQVTQTTVRRCGLVLNVVCIGVNTVLANGLLA